MVPAAGFGFSFQADLVGGVSFEGVERPSAQAAEVLSRMAFADAAVVFCELHVEAPMQRVFDAPVAADQFEHLAGIASPEAGDVVMMLRGAPTRLSDRVLRHTDRRCCPSCKWIHLCQIRTKQPRRFALVELWRCDLPAGRWNKLMTPTGQPVAMREEDRAVYGPQTDKVLVRLVDETDGKR